MELNATTPATDIPDPMDAAQQFEALRPQLFALSYRALGSRSDAEDVVQDAYLRWQTVDQATVASPKAYLMTVVSRLSLDQLRSARRKREEYIGVWLPEPLVTVSNSGSPDPGLSRPSSETPESQAMLAESVSTAFLFVLESLTPPERLAFLLHDVFAYGYVEIAAILESTEAACRQLVSRARKHVKQRRPRFTADPDRHRAVLQQFFAACANQDIAGLMTLLREDAVSYSDGGGKAAAAINPIEGADRVARFFLGITKKTPAGLRYKIESVNGVPSLWLLENDALVSLFTFDLDQDGKIAWLLVQRNPDKLPE